MGRRKTSNNDTNQNSSSSHQLHDAKTRFDDPDETTECSNHDESMCEPDGDEKTSADYYFDSYSHFGKPRVQTFRLVSEKTGEKKRESFEMKPS
jgi:protein arginine N-methyltransferase 1